MSRDEAVALFKEKGEDYKVQILESIPGDEVLSFYQQGEFIDLCRGPHIPDTGKLKAFKLTKVAGAYWRGDSNNEMLQRIYGTAWGDKKALKDYLFRIEEAEKRDHRKLGKRLDLFHVQDIAPGMVFWHPRGWQIWQVLEQYIRDVQNANGYQEIKTPQVVDMSLWQKSGHADKFSDDMFSLSSDSREYAIKPMNCPCHVQVFNQGLKSYRDLPIRLAEFGSCHRNEPSGTLQGIMRVRGFVQDDAHIFCRDDQIHEEVLDFITVITRVYQDFGFDDIIIKLSTRPEKRVGSDEVWDRAEQALADALDDKALEWEELPGEGAFYGPKIEFSLKDCLGRVWQCGTIQVDSDGESGTRISILLPLQEAEVTVAVPQTAGTVTHGKEKMILFADDAPEIRELAKTVLEDTGYRIVEAEDGEQAIDVFKQHHEELHLVILDLMMPKKTGLEAYFEISEIDASVPVVFSSGFNESDLMQQLPAKTRAVFLKKPYLANDLKQFVEGLIGERR